MRKDEKLFTKNEMDDIRKVFAEFGISTYNTDPIITTRVTQLALALAQQREETERVVLSLRAMGKVAKGALEAISKDDQEAAALLTQLLCDLSDDKCEPSEASSLGAIPPALTFDFNDERTMVIINDAAELAYLQKWCELRDVLPPWIGERGSYPVAMSPCKGVWTDDLSRDTLEYATFADFVQWVGSLKAAR